MAHFGPLKWPFLAKPAFKPVSGRMVGLVEVKIAPGNGLFYRESHVKGGPKHVKKMLLWPFLHFWCQELSKPPSRDRFKGGFCLKRLKRGPKRVILDPFWTPFGPLLGQNAHFPVSNLEGRARVGSLYGPKEAI